VLWIW
jgi:hypothetical protein